MQERIAARFDRVIIHQPIVDVRIHVSLLLSDKTAIFLLQRLDRGHVGWCSIVLVAALILNFKFLSALDFETFSARRVVIRFRRE